MVRQKSPDINTRASATNASSLKTLALFRAVGACTRALGGHAVNVSDLLNDHWPIPAATLRSILAQPLLLQAAATKEQLIECLEREDAG